MFDYQNNFDFMFMIYTIILVAIIAGVIIGLMSVAKKRYKKNMTDDNMEDTEGLNNGSVTFYRPDLKKK
jgi:uncharacterized membrane-anchored protein YhcB (DUF1043 family)